MMAMPSQRIELIDPAGVVLYFMNWVKVLSDRLIHCFKIRSIILEFIEDVFGDH
jgi:hypothetical protein